MRLRDMRAGETATVVGYEVADPTYRAKLLAMGLTKGCALTLVKVAPLGDPIKVEVRGYDLSLRKAEADALIVEPGLAVPVAAGAAIAPGAPAGRHQRKCRRGRCCDECR
jgi:ferrous iron transport protein A